MPSACKTNEALTVDYIYSGDGHLKFIQEPKLQWPGEFEVYDPEIIDRIKVTSTGESGSRTFRYVIIPRAPGEYSLPSVQGEWFNIKTRTTPHCLKATIAFKWSVEMPVRLQVSITIPKQTYRY